MIKATINMNFHSLKPAASIAMMDKARSMKAAGINVISLAGGEPDFDTPVHITDAAVRALRDGQTHYTTGRGIGKLRERIAEKLRVDNGIECNSSNILVTPGGKYSIFTVLITLINPGDEVLILDPSWLSYGPMVQIAGGVPVRIPLSFDNNYEITEELLEQNVSEKTRIMIINTPNNPTGRVLSEAEARVISGFLQKHDLMLISDEVYEKIIYDDRKHISIGSYPEIADRVITVNGFSKCVAMTGWRIGYLCANRELVDKCYLFYQHTMTCISEFAQEAAYVALDCINEMEQMRKSYELRRDFLIEKLQQIPGIECRVPEGAFYAWCRIEKGDLSSLELSEFLLEQAKVVTVPGIAYGLGTEKCIRMSFATAMEELEIAAESIKVAMTK